MLEFNLRESRIIKIATKETNINCIESLRNIGHQVGRNHVVTDKKEIKHWDLYAYIWLTECIQNYHEINVTFQYL